MGNSKLISFILLFGLIVFTTSSCKTEAVRFQDEAVKMAGDSRIDEAEYQKLVEMISQSKDGSLKILREPDDSVSPGKLQSYLLKLFAAKKLSISANEIWQPTVAGVDGLNVDVYVENSASMDGYVKGTTEFETAIYNFLGDLKVSGLAKTLNLNYINSKVTYTRANALQPDLQDFIERLEPTTFAQRGGNRGTSDLQTILKAMLDGTKDDNLEVLISDFVFSPGKNKDAADYLNNQSVGIKIEFAEKLKSMDLAIAVIRLGSRFDGTYYDKFDKEHALKCSRPYYIWVFGNTRNIKALLEKRLIDTIKGGSLNRLTFTASKEPIPIDYKVLVRPRVGTFELPSGARGPLMEARPEKNAFEFTVAVNFPGSLQDPNYFLNANNYRLSDPRYTVAIQPVNPSDPTGAGFTHKLVFHTNEFQEGPLDVAVVGKVPAWVDSASSVDDTGISCTSDEVNKTFGFRHLIDGVNEAFFPPSSPTDIYNARIVIKR